MRDPGPRLIGNVAIEVDLGAGPQVLAGFENHGGRTHLGPGAQPLGRVLKGHGNNGADGYEGVRGGARGTVLGTYLHGPLLPKNAWFADWLAATALGRAPWPSWPRWTTPARMPRTRARAAPPASDAVARPAFPSQRVGFPLTSRGGPAL